MLEKATSYNELKGAGLECKAAGFEAIFLRAIDGWDLNSLWFDS